MVSSQQRLSFSNSMLVFFFCFLSLFCRPSLSASFLVDGVSVWKTPVVHVSDSVVFRHKYGNDLYIFRTKDAFNVCDFTQATLLTKSNSTSFTWYPSRPGSYYFSFTNNTSLPKTCQVSQKLTVQVILAAAPSPSQPPTPAIAPVPVSEGGVVSSSPSYPWPLGPREGSVLSPGPSPSEITSVTVPGKDGVPFINSNPAVPLPTGEVDSTSINPLPTSTNSAHQVMMTATLKLVLCCVAMFLLL
ncbi:Cupredoxin superfamily protein [Raphanus sativus]|uniref:Early nodulin-like protein 15 n=1 Tax=Raphanus sativus TaxID=3726 RepID=A0A6J0M6P1_RAPSA|nr:early nodulin-like protein 15 [Raphanus sativus]KAJ4916304.1 Cupredoxin superfamily protein [Raphanus sativus]